MAILEKPFMEVDSERCKGCQLCTVACPKQVIKVAKKFNSKGYHYSYYVGEGCIGCGMCFYNCPEPDAITVYKKGAEYKGKEVG